MKPPAPVTKTFFKSTVLPMACATENGPKKIDRAYCVRDVRREQLFDQLELERGGQKFARLALDLCS